MGDAGRWRAAARFGRVVHEQSGGRERWYVEAWIGGRRHRARRIPGAGAPKSAEEANELLEAIRADIRAGRSELQAMRRYLGPGAGERLFETHWARFLEHKARQREASGQLSAARLQELRAHRPRGHLEPLLERPVDELVAADLEDWRDWIFESFPHLSANTVAHVLRDVGTCLRWLARRGDLAAAPPLPIVRIPDHCPRVPSRETQARILESIPWPVRGAYLARGLMGLRPSEARRANAGDVDLERGTLGVLGKGGRWRALPLHPDVEAWIRDQVPAKAFGARPLFVNPRARNPERRWTRAASRRVWMRANELAGVHYRENEGLRHAFATHAVERGFDLDQVGAYLGHTSTSTTRRYARIATGELRELVGRGDR